MVKKFVNALQFLTIVTVDKKHVVAEGDLAKSMIYFPFIGFLIGLVLVYVDKAFIFFALPQTVANLLLVMLLVLLTRALHIDGLADTLDGLMGGETRESRLAIMKDSRIGTAGVIGIFFALLFKYLLLNSLLSNEKAAALLTAPTLARWSQTLMIYKMKYAREHGMAKAFVGHLRAGTMMAASVVAVCLIAFVMLREDVRALYLIAGMVIVVTLTTLFARWFLGGKLGGVTGDAIGAVTELNEVVVLLFFVVFAGISF